MLGQIAYKIRTAGSKLMEWHKTDFNKQRKEARIIEEKLNDLMRQPYSPHQYEEQKQLHIQLSKILAAQEKYWRQRSSITWLKDGDRNSAFFHRRACNRKSKNTIKGMIDESGNWTTNPEDIERIIMQYLGTIFSTEQVDATALQEILDVTPSKVTPEMNAMLLMPYTDEEMRQVVFQMHPSKSPGLDVNIPDKTISWSMEKRGDYTVKTTYWLARESVMGNALASSSHGDPCKVLWKRIWKACVPHKVQTTIWRACGGILPTAKKGFHRGLELYPVSSQV
ncbi:hypothetical protein ACLB2K_076780 [Fragaria x ananassa]